MPSSSSQRHRHDTAILIVFSLIMTLGVFVFSAGPRASGDKVVVFVPPWSSDTNVVEVIAAANGALLRGGKWHWIALAQSDDPGFVHRLYWSGAFFVGGGEAFSACFSPFDPIDP
ncbi:hypothetical protein FDK21_16215 [Cohaesibacter sp. CAU 1516]|uniref:hypothetical protein n=1 Tax=Cohaesibacter sp. CAU 1516 TaxID=2576038 RepID=UPI0010FF051B|nr:hypothetical protein [Cohaesibacter sp. CAU 1516]TLP43769.1 hypothetical protein FDK21_16215 [Cohaesibacter sp. CAU 1516]